MARPRKRRPTVLMRVFKDDLDAVNQIFPNVTKADFFHMTIRTNPMLQVEAALRGKRKKNVRK